MEEALERKIDERAAQVVVLGLGYVGLPVACLFAEAGFPVAGIRRSQEKVDLINRGICPIEGKEPGLAELLRSVVAGGRFQATTDYEACREADIVLIAVETPVEAGSKKPAYTALRGALQDLAPRLRRGSMVVIESTIAPKTMQLLVRPLLEEGSGLSAIGDFFLVNCPERVMPGKLLANIRSCHRVVGGMTPQAAELAASFYRHVVRADLDPVDCLTAEMVKTMENAYRDVQIAFANEMALLCEDLGADVWQVRELVNKSPYRAMHLPGAGVGGHCIPKDPWLLIANASPSFRAPLTRAARAVNDSMPQHVVALLEKGLARSGRSLAGSRVLVMGYAYLENSDDTRNSPSEVLIDLLQEMDVDVVVHDPVVPGYQADVLEMAHGCDAVAIMVKHDSYCSLEPKALNVPVIVDGRRVFDRQVVEEAGYLYYCLGVSS